MTVGESLVVGVVVAVLIGAFIMAAAVVNGILSHRE